MRAHRLNSLHVFPVRTLVACLALAFGGDAFAARTVTHHAVAPIRPSGKPQSTSHQSSARTAFQSAFDKSLEAAPAQPAATFVVKNCDDSGQDSLRDAVIAANTLNVDSAIEFDVSAMGCSTITLTTGQITISVQNLTIIGPSPDTVTISGGDNFGNLNRIFKHTGQGVLHLDHLVLRNATYSTAGNQQALGGCIYSNGTAYLSSTRLDSCHVMADAAIAAGGGVWARGVKLIDSVVSNSSASSQSQAAGGGIEVQSAGGLAIKDSTISNNLALSYAQNPDSLGGGVDAHSDATIEHSTISGNRAAFGGGLNSTKSVALANSTISSNTASGEYGGMSLGGGAAIYNSTIALNTANGSSRAAGVEAASVYAVSSIIAKNVASGDELDVHSDDGLLGGSVNLIIAADATVLPVDTLGGCPRLAPLSNNGGNTRTHALMPGSPAIDAGDDPFNLGTDQRRAGFNRVVGAHADIGAYEWSAGSGDVINSSGFETCE